MTDSRSFFFLIYAFKAVYLAAFLSKQFSLYPTNVELCFHFHLVQAVVTIRTSLVVRWLGLHFSAGAQVLSLVGEVPQCLWIQEKQTHTHWKSKTIVPKPDLSPLTCHTPKPIYWPSVMMKKITVFICGAPSNREEMNPEYTLEGLMLKLQLQYFGHLM